MTTANEANLKQTNGALLKILTFATTIGLAVASYFLSTTMDKINEIDKRVQSLEVSAAAVSSNRFTSGDFIKAKEILDTTQLQNEKRITILEQNHLAVRELLIEIKSDLKELKEK